MFFYLILSFFGTCFSARIVYNGMHASSSHIGSMLPVAMRMASDGHEVHFLESNSKNVSYNYPPKITATYCQLPESVILQKVIIPAMWVHTYQCWDFPFVWTSGDKALVDMYEMHNDKLLSVMEGNWDLAIADELFAVASYGLALKTKEKQKPFIMMATCVQMNPMRSYLSLGGHVNHRPSMFIKEREPFDVSTFQTRLNTVGHAAVIYPGIWYFADHIAIQGLKLLGFERFELSRLGREASYYFVDEMNPLIWPASTGNEVLHVGFHCPQYKRQPLPADYRNFLEDSKSKGTILIAFGTNVMWTAAPDNIVQAFVGAINRLKDYRFVFAFNGRMEQLGAEIGSHCRITSWAPQKEILNHNNTKVFVSHGGLKSVKDTVCGTVPAVYMPLFAEQTHNSEMARQMGIGEIINKYEVTEDLLVEAILNIAENVDYKKNVIRIKDYMLDQPISSMDLISFATRRSLKCKDRYPTFKRKGMYLSYLEYLYLDLAMILTVIFVLISY